MPVYDSTIDQKLIKAAKEEFLEKGFDKASTNEICKKAGVTSGALFKRYKNKEELYYVVVNPTIKYLKSWYKMEYDKFFDDNNDYLSKMKEASYDESFVDIIYDNYDIYKIIICRSTNDQLHEFFNYFVEYETRSMVELYDNIDPDIMKKHNITQKVIHLLATSYFSGLFEVVRHDMNREDAKKYARTLAIFYKNGTMGFVEK